MNTLGFRILATSALAIATPLFAQSATLTVPDLTETYGVANASTGQPWAMTTTSVRTQQLYGAGDFPYATPLTITRVRFYPRTYVPSAASWTGGTYQMEIRMSTSAATAATMSTTYAANEGADMVVVHNGAVPLTAGSVPGPWVPYVDLTLSTPFTYDPIQGSLLVDMISDGTLYTGGTAYFPGARRYNQANGARVWHSGNTTDTSGTYENECALVMDLDFTFSGLHPDFYAGERGAPVGTAVQFHDRSITSDAGGITSWAWDFDGNGSIDSNLQNPSHAYAAPGLYDVSLTVTDASSGSPQTKTRSACVVVGVTTPSVPDLIQYQFNEVRGTAVANTATGALFPAAGTVSNPGWHGDPGAGREGFGGIEAGYGVMGISGLTDDNVIDTGAGLAWTGSLSISWWQRMDATAPQNAWAYLFGGPGDTFSLYNRGGAYETARFGTGVIDRLMCLKSLHHPDWVHQCIVIDDTVGVATWYVDGLPAGSKAFPAGTHVTTNTQFLVGKDINSATHARYYTNDDFRVYGRALSYGEVLGTMAGENASAGRFGSECWAFGSVPTIGAIGRPVFGNGSFATTFTGGVTNGNIPLVAPIGFFAAGGLPAPLPANFFCGNLEVSPDLIAFVTTDANGDATQSLPVPYAPEFVGLHVYTQFVSLFGTTQALDLNLQLQ